MIEYKQARDIMRAIIKGVEETTYADRVRMFDPARRDWSDEEILAVEAPARWFGFAPLSLMGQFMWHMGYDSVTDDKNDFTDLLVLTPEAKSFLYTTQDYEDDGYTWGEAVERAEMYKKWNIRQGGENNV